MNKFIFLSFLFFSIDARKYIINEHGSGFFADFIKVLNHLVYCSERELTPVVHWGANSLYYEKDGYRGQTNAWEYYFQPVSDEYYNKNNKVAGSMFKNPKGWFVNTIDENFIETHRHFLKGIIDKYIKLQPWIEEEVASFYREYMEGKITIGIHVRGTDKKIEASPIPPSIYVEAAQEMVRQFGDVQFLVATDQESICQYLKEHLPGPVIYYKAIRSLDGKPLHYLSKHENRAQLGKDVLIEALLLSQCTYFIHSQSNVALGVLFFNPELPHTWLKVANQYYSVWF